MDDDYVVLRIEGVTPAAAGGLQGMTTMRTRVSRGGFDRPWADMAAPPVAGAGALESLRNLRAAPEIGTGSPLNLGGDRPRMTAEQVQLSPAQLHEAARDPQNLVSRAFPVVAITLQSQAAGSAAAGTAGARDWGLAETGADGAHLDGKARDVVVAVLDSGIDRAHAAFPPDIDIVTESFVGGGTGDAQGHGTHCASLIFGRPVDGVRLGVAPSIRKALVAKVFDDAGGSSTGAVVNALAWAYREKANIVSMSLSFDFESMFRRLTLSGWDESAAIWETLVRYREAVDQLQRQIDVLRMVSIDDPGILIVAAAGNQSRRDKDKPYDVRTGIPAAATGVLSVGAVGRDRQVPAFSNINPVLVGPGVSVVGAKAGGGLVAMDGTSAAAPHVAGLAALWWDALRERNGRVTADDVAASLRARTRRLAGVKPEQQGAGLALAPPASLD